jgi:hypothetical protein
VDTGVVTDARCRPGIYGDKVFYYLPDSGPSGEGGTWHKLTFDTDLAITDDAAFSDFTDFGSIYPTGDNDAFLCYLDDGGVGIRLSLDGEPAITAQSRFINPAALVTDLYLTHFAGAAQTDAGRFFYFSCHDGSIKCVKFSNGMFSDFEVSIPSEQYDLYVLSLREKGGVCLRDEVHPVFLLRRWHNIQP